MIGSLRKKLRSLLMTWGLVKPRKQLRVLIWLDVEEYWCSVQQWHESTGRGNSVNFRMSDDGSQYAFLAQMILETLQRSVPTTLPCAFTQTVVGVEFTISPSSMKYISLSPSTLREHALYLARADSCEDVDESGH